MILNFHMVARVSVEDNESIMIAHARIIYLFVLLLVLLSALRREPFGSATVHSTKHNADVYVPVDALQRATRLDDGGLAHQAILIFVVGTSVVPHVHQTVFIRFKVSTGTERKLHDWPYVAEELQLVEAQVNEPGERPNSSTRQR